MHTETVCCSCSCVLLSCCSPLATQLGSECAAALTMAPLPSTSAHAVVLCCPLLYLYSIAPPSMTRSAPAT
jgi:hypothetical protein